MKRRNFLYNASLGTLGFTCFSGFLPVSTNRNLRSSLDVFFQAIGAHRQSWLSAEPMLEEACSRGSVAWKKTGYEPLYREFFLCRKGQKALFLLHLPHKELGSIGVSALIFQKDPITNNWQFEAALSGFQLEILTRAAVSLQASYTPDRLAALLLPVTQLGRQSSFQFVSELGAVSTKATLSKDKVMRIEATVFENEHIIWSSENAAPYLQTV